MTALSPTAPDVPDPLEARLAQFRDQFLNRRTVPWEMFTVAEGMVRDSAAYHRRLAEAAVEPWRAKVAELEDRVRLRDQTIERLTEDRKLQEARQAEGDEVRVRIDRALGGWTVADLEEVAYRLRCGGAADDTLIKWAEYSVSALVPAPDLVTLSRPRPVPAITYVPAPPETHPPMPTSLSVWLGTWIIVTVAVALFALSRVL